MQMKLEILSACTIAYIRNVGPYGESNIQAMEQIKAWARENRLFDETAVILGIAYDDQSVVASADCRYDACLILPEDYQFTGDVKVSVKKLVGGKYAVFPVAHTAEALMQAWAGIFPMLLQSGHRMDETRPIMERYAASMVQNHECEICVPIQ